MYGFDRTPVRGNPGTSVLLGSAVGSSSVKQRHSSLVNLRSAGGAAVTAAARRA
jgi:hypothetical protein